MAATGTLTINNPSHVVPTYPPVMEQPDEGGNVTVSPKNPTVGSKVTVTPDPDADCTRGQIVTFLWRSQNSSAADSVNSFADVKADAYYAPAVAWAAANGVTGGTGDDKFSPDADCTRAQIVTFLYRCLGDE